jgi:hypothetical protein
MPCRLLFRHQLIFSPLFQRHAHAAIDMMPLMPPLRYAIAFRRHFRLLLLLRRFDAAAHSRLHCFDCRFLSFGDTPLRALPP